MFKKKASKGGNFGIVIGITLLVLLLVGGGRAAEIGLPNISQETGLSDALQMPGRLEANGTHFELNNSDYLNITLDSSEPINLTLESAPEMVTMNIESASSAVSTQITISGFLPLATYHKYEDNYHNHIAFATDANGNYSYSQDLSKTHLIFIQPRPSTWFINDNSTGGDCASIGVWDATTKTCTLITDLNETIQIDSNGTTLDGDHHTITGSSTGNGIYLPERSGVTVKNVNVRQFFYGFNLFSSNNNHLISNNASNNEDGILLDSSSNNTLNSNTANSNDFQGIWLELSSNSTLNDNTADSNGFQGIWLESSSNSTLNGNIADLNGYQGIWLESSSNSTLNGNIANLNGYQGIWLESSSSSTLNGNIANLNGYQGIWLESSSNSMLNNNKISNNNEGVYLDSSSNNILINNIADSNGDGISLYSSGGNIIYHNNLINKYNSYDDTNANIWDNGYPDGGNYWSDYTGSDMKSGPNQDRPGSDGIGDIPYPIPGGSGVDMYPLMKPCGTTITVTSPNGGENWQAGTTQTIKWSYTGTFGSDVKIELLKSGVVDTVIIPSTPIGSSGGGSYTWTIFSTQTLETDYQIKITSTANPAYSDTSDGYFVISSPLVSSIFGTPGSNPNVPFSYEPVNLGSGNYIYQYNDLFIPGRGLPLTITRSYNSLDSYNGSFGYGWTFNYNINLNATSNGDLVVMREDGRRDTYTLNSNGSYTSPLGVYDTLAKNPDGTYTLNKKDQIKYDFTSQGKLNNIVDKNGNQINLTHSGNSLTNVTDASGRELTFTYDAADRIIAITDIIGRTWSYAYDDMGNLVRYTNPMGGQFSYTYNEKHWMTSITDPRGEQIMTNTYDKDGRVINQGNALGVITNFSYDVNNRKTTVSDPLGRNRIYIYNDHFWELNETDALGNTTSHAYNGNGNKISVTDANGRITKYTYDANGNIIQIINPMGNSTILTYDSKNNLISGTDALGHRTIFEYDANSNPVKITNALGYVTTFTYDQYGQLINSKDANGHATSFAYDNYGNPIGIADALGNTVTFSYDSVGHLLKATDAKGGTNTLNYDALNRVINITDPLGHTASYSYDGIGNRISFTDAVGSITNYSYDPLNQLTKVTDALGGTISYAYDPIGNMIAMIDANGHTKNYTYDPLNRLAAVTDPLGHTASCTYDAIGNTASVTDNNGNTTRLTYDALNRLTKVLYQDGTSVSYTYNAVSDRMAMTDNSGMTSYTYDELNRLTSVADSNGQVVKYGYDPVGNRIQMTYPVGKKVSYAYDGASRLIGVNDLEGRNTIYTYDANNNLISMTYPNGMIAEYEYDKAGRLVKLVNKDKKGIASSFEYTLDAIGNRLKVNEQFKSGFSEEQPEADESEADLKNALEHEGNELKRRNSLVTTYEYDKLNRLNKVTYPLGIRVTYTYDHMGNRLSTITGIGKKNFAINYEYDAADRLLRIGGVTYAYDNNGNLIVKNELGKSTSYGYDATNKLTSVATSLQSPKGLSIPENSFKDNSRDVLINFAYDGDGNRISEAITRGKKTNLTRYVWDVSSVLPQVLIKADGKETAIYTYGLNRISMMDPRGGQIYYHYDGLGSVRSLSDSRGVNKAMYSYDAFGQPRLTKGHVDNDFLFTGEQLDEETGLIYLRARYYDPNIGRFINKDPFPAIGTMTQNINRYVYTMNNPVNRVDPSGKVVPLAIGLAGGTVNELFYLGHIAVGDETFSWSVAGGRFTGGAAGALAFSGALVTTGNPWAAGAVGSATSYIVDSATQKTLSAIGVPGKTENPSLSGLIVSTGSGAVMGGISSYVFPPNVGTNPTHLTTLLTGKEMQKEILRNTFEQSGQEFMEGSFENILSSGYPQNSQFVYTYGNK